MSDAQQWAATVDMLTGARNKGDGGTGLPLDDRHLCSYGFRPGRRAQDAIAETWFLAKHSYEWVVKGDIEACFDMIDHTTLMDRVRRRIGDKRVLNLVKAFLRAGILTQDRSVVPLALPGIMTLRGYGYRLVRPGPDDGERPDRLGRTFSNPRRRIPDLQRAEPAAVRHNAASLRSRSA